MKKLLKLVAFVCLSLPAFAQNLATVSASNIQDLNGAKLATGQLCFLGTDNNDNPISFQVGGGGQILKRGFCSAVSSGVVASFTVPNPANTSPTGIYYRVTVKDSSTGVEVLRYTGVTFSGGTFSFDAYTPNITGASFSPLSGTSVTGNLSVSGNLSVTGTFAAGSLGSIGVTALTDSGSLTQTQPTAATAGANQSSFLDCEQGTYWNGAASASDQYCWQDVISAGTNPTTTWTLTHSGSSGASVIAFPSTATLTTGPISASGAATFGSIPTPGAIGGTTPNTGAFTTIRVNGGTILTGQTGTGTSIVTNTGPTISSPVINGTPSGTGIPTLTLKKGSGAATYTTASTTYVVMDSTNLCYTVTIPTGWKLSVQAQGVGSTSGSPVQFFVALSDNASCSTANAGLLQEGAFTPIVATANTGWALGWIINGDGASHNIALQFKTTNAPNPASIVNGSTITPTMVFNLSPSN